MSTVYNWNQALDPIMGLLGQHFAEQKFKAQLDQMMGQETTPGVSGQQMQAQLPGQQMPGQSMPAAVPGNPVTARAGYHPMLTGGPVSAGGGPIDISTPNIAPQTSFNGPVGQALGNDQASALLPILQALGPQSMPLLLKSTQDALARKQEVADKTMRTLTPAEAKAKGYRDGSVVQEDPFGTDRTAQASDLHSQGAMDQEFAQKQREGQLPMTPYQQATVKDAQATAAETRRHNQAVEAQGDTPPDPNTIKYWAQSVAAGAPMPTLGMGKQAAAYRQAILKEVATLNGGKGMTGADQNANIATTKANTSSLAKITPLRAATEAYEGTMLQNMDLAKSMIAKGAGTTGVPVLNRWQNYVKGQYAGDPDVAAFQTAIQTVKNEYAKIQSGSIGNAPVTDSARKEAEHMLDPSQTPQQIMANFNYMVQETGNRTRALRTQEQALRSGLSGDSDTPHLPAAQQTPTQSKVIGGVTYHLVNGKWMQE